MGFWQDLWQGTKRVFSQSCPNCKKNDADLPSEKRIIRTVISQHPHYHTHYHKGHDGKMHSQVKCTYMKDIKFSCQSCGHKWTDRRIESYPDYIIK
jgi:hypothetical protein